MYVQDPKDTSTWTTFWVKIWKGTSVNLQGQEAVRYVRENTSNLCEPFQSAIDWTPEDAQCNIDEMKYWVPVPWDNHSGRVTLLGDASHPMLPCKHPPDASFVDARFAPLANAGVKSVARDCSMLLQMLAITWMSCCSSAILPMLGGGRRS